MCFPFLLLLFLCWNPRLAFKIHVLVFLEGFGVHGLGFRQGALLQFMGPPKGKEHKYPHYSLGFLT